MAAGSNCKSGGHRPHTICLSALHGGMLLQHPCTRVGRLRTACSGYSVLGLVAARRALGEGWQLPGWHSVPCLFALSYQKPRAAPAALLPGEAKPCHRILHQDAASMAHLPRYKALAVGGTCYEPAGVSGVTCLLSNSWTW